jgi:SEC-C motif
MTLPVTVDRLRTVLTELLVEGAQSSTNLAVRAGDMLGIVIDESTVEEILEQTSSTWYVGIDGFADPQFVFDGWTLTHRVTAEEEALGILTAYPDFAIMLALALEIGEGHDAHRHSLGLPFIAEDSERQSLPPITPTSIRWADSGNPFLPKDPETGQGADYNDDSDFATDARFYGPDGWLHGLSGQLVGFTLRGETWHFEGPIELASPTETTVLDALVTGALGRCLEEADIAYLYDKLAQEIVSAMPLASEPARLPTGIARPLTELMVEANLSYHDGAIGPGDTDWAEYEDAKRTQDLGRLLGVSPAAAKAVARVTAGMIAWSGLGDVFTDGQIEALRLELHPFLVVPDAAQTLAWRMFALDATMPSDPLTRWEEFLNFLQTGAPPKARAVIAFLLARLSADHKHTEELLKTAIAADARCVPALDERIWLYACQGNQQRMRSAMENWIDAANLDTKLQSTHTTIDPSIIMRFAATHEAPVTVRNTITAGRNDDCPCGSGRKYKKCHLNKELPPTPAPSAAASASITPPSAASSDAPTTSAPESTANSSAADTPSVNRNASPTSRNLSADASGADPHSAQDSPAARPQGEAQLQPTSDLRSLVTRLQALQLLYIDRTQPRTTTRIASRLARTQSGDQLNVTVTVILDTIARTPESTAAFITAATNAGVTWSSEVRALIERWTETTLSIFEVVDRAVGLQLTLRDLRNGNRYVVDAPDTSRTYPIDSLILSRVIWNSRSYQFAMGTVPVPLRDRDSTLALLDEYDGNVPPHILSDWVVGDAGRYNSHLSLRMRDDELRNTDGDIIVFHRSQYRFDDSLSHDDVCAHIDALLGDRLTVGGVRSSSWSFVRPDDPHHWVRGSVNLVLESGLDSANDSSNPEPWLIDTSTNSYTRNAEIRTLLESRLGPLELLCATADTQSEIDQARDLGLHVAYMTPPGADEQPELTPELIDQLTKTMDQRWMDNPVPALGNLSPRAAALDPTRRDDLRKLLESFAAMPLTEGTFALNPHRIAKELDVKLHDRRTTIRFASADSPKSAPFVVQLSTLRDPN